MGGRKGESFYHRGVHAQGLYSDRIWYTKSVEIQIHQIMQNPLTQNVKIEHQWHIGHEFATIYDAFISTKLHSL